MADTYTTNLNLTKPGIGESDDTWGTKLNNNLDAVDVLFSTGPVLKLEYGGTAATTAAAARTNLGLGSLATASAVTEAQITDGTILARVGSNETVTGNWTFSGTVAFSGSVTGLTIAETAITDGSLLARNAGNEAITGTWSFSVVPTKASAGKFLHYGSATQTGGAVTLSTSAASGTPAAGDIWIQHSA